jgi:hypothetical protein
MTARLPTLRSADQGDLLAWSRQLTNAVSRQIKSMGTGVVTLAENVTTTAVADQLATVAGAVFLMPTTANAAAALSTTFIVETDVVSGQFTITHANNAQTDRTFFYLVFDFDGGLG